MPLRISILQRHYSVTSAARDRKAMTIILYPGIESLNRDLFAVQLWVTRRVPVGVYIAKLSCIRQLLQRPKQLVLRACGAVAYI